MKSSSASVQKAVLRFTGMALFSMTVGAGAAGAETFRYGGSTATIEQSGGSGKSNTRITRYEDGQQTITQDGSSTDITIQRSAGYPASGYSRDYPWSGGTTSTQFKRRILDRIRGRFSP